jgi:hypothetical protein
VKTILADRIPSGVLDRYLGGVGYDNQQEAAADPNAPNNLFRAHGAFTDRAQSRSVQLWASKHRAWVTLGALILAAAGSTFLRNGDD